MTAPHFAVRPSLHLCLGAGDTRVSQCMHTCAVISILDAKSLECLPSASAASRLLCGTEMIDAVAETVGLVCLFSAGGSQDVDTGEAGKRGER